MIPDVLKNFYFDAFARAQAQGVWEFSYECSSPDLFRKYRMRVHRLRKMSWLLLTNPLIHECPDGRMAKPPSDPYVQATGLITLCAHIADAHSELTRPSNGILSLTTYA